jgi:hypothetical protein
MRRKLSAKIVMFAFWIWPAVHVARAGPPFTTDDPEPPEYRHWEIYLASQLAHDSNGWSGTSPHLELDYGAIPNFQLSLTVPVAFDAPSKGGSQFGYGDTELGGKYRQLSLVQKELEPRQQPLPYRKGSRVQNFRLRT